MYSKNRKDPLPCNTHYSVLLLFILKKAKAPLYLFDEIINWTKKVYTECPSFFKNSNVSREKTISDLEYRYNLFGYRPKTETVTLPSSNITDIVTHDVEYALHSLLSDPDLMQDENLLINSKKPWEPLEYNGCFGDLHTGSLYRDGWKQYCTN